MECFVMDSFSHHVRDAYLSSLRRQIGRAIPNTTPPEEARRLHERYACTEDPVIACLPETYRRALLARLRTLVVRPAPEEVIR
jgi:hypothetical protein